MRQSPGPLFVSLDDAFFRKVVEQTVNRSHGQLERGRHRANAHRPLAGEKIENLHRAADRGHLASGNVQAWGDAQATSPGARQYKIVLATRTGHTIPPGRCVVVFHI